MFCIDYSFQDYVIVLLMQLVFLKQALWIFDLTVERIIQFFKDILFENRKFGQVQNRSPDIIEIVN